MIVPFGASGRGLAEPAREAGRAECPGGGRSRDPAGAGIAESSLDPALQLVEAVNDVPATAVMLLPPFYFHPLGEDGLAGM